MDMNRPFGRPFANRPAAITAAAFWVAGGIFALFALGASGLSVLLLLLIAAVLTVGGSILFALDALRFDLLMARIAAEAIGASSVGAPAPRAGSSEELPRAKPYVRPPWEHQPPGERPEGP